MNFKRAYSRNQDQSFHVLIKLIRGLYGTKYNAEYAN
jgi:hypothetical protein